LPIWEHRHEENMHSLTSSFPGASAQCLPESSGAGKLTRERPPWFLSCAGSEEASPGNRHKISPTTTDSSLLYKSLKPLGEGQKPHWAQYPKPKSDGDLPKIRSIFLSTHEESRSEMLRKSQPKAQVYGA